MNISREHLELLSQNFKNIDETTKEIINLEAILTLPKGTEHFLSDIHGEYEAFDHILRNGSGIIKEKLKELEKYNTRAYSITHQEKYKLWLEQKHISPYTGQIISLENLFTDNYEIEHIIPQSRFFDDSLSNKVVCESIVNKAPYKDRQLGLEFIKNQETSFRRNS